MEQPQEPTPQVVAKNIRALLEVKRSEEKRKSTSQRTSDAITQFVGSLLFVWLHAGILVFWLFGNTGKIPGLKPWDPYPFVMLAMIASVEAIFISTFVLISQNRMGEQAERRAELDLQMNLLAEHEITRVLQILEAVADRVGVANKWEDLEDLKREIAPEQVLSAIEEHVEADQSEGSR